MGLGSSKPKRDITITAADIGVVRISEEAVENITETVETAINKEKQKTNEENNKVKEVIVEKIVPSENEIALAARLEEYEKSLVNNFKKATTEVEEMFRDRYKTMPICVDLQQLVMECYSQNSKSSLKCLDISEKYIKCVENERLNRFKKIPSSGS